MMLLKCYTQYVSKFGKLSNGHRTGTGQFSLQSQRRAITKNVQIVVQLHSFHMLARLCSTSLKLDFSSTWTENFQIYKLVQQGRGTRDQITNIRWIIEKAREFQKNICIIDSTIAFDCVDHNKLWTILQEMGIPDHLTCLLRNLYVGAGQEVAVRTRHGTTDWFKIGKGLCRGWI